jgi:hypothetical protein
VWTATSIVSQATHAPAAAGQKSLTSAITVRACESASKM